MQHPNWVMRLTLAHPLVTNHHPVTLLKLQHLTSPRSPAKNRSTPCCSARGCSTKIEDGPDAPLLRCRKRGRESTSLPHVFQRLIVFVLRPSSSQVLSDILMRMCLLILSEFDSTVLQYQDAVYSEEL